MRLQGPRSCAAAHTRNARSIRGAGGVHGGKPRGSGDAAAGALLGRGVAAAGARGGAGVGHWLRERVDRRRALAASKVLHTGVAQPASFT